MRQTETYSSAAAAQPVTAPAMQPEARQEAPRAPVLVTGASGFVGMHVCHELCRRGWSVRALAHSPGKAAQRLAGLSLEIVVGDLRDASVVHRAVGGMGTVVHLAAIAIERAGQRYEQVNADATATLLREAKAARVERFVHMSQNGASSGSPYRFLRSKGMAEDAVRDSTIGWTVLRPSVIFGREDEFVNVLARLVRLSPLVYPLPGGGTALFQPIAVGDVARAVVTALDMPETSRHVYSLGGAEPMTLRDIVERVLATMQVRRHLVSVPVPLLRPVVALLQQILPRPPVTTGLLDLLALDNTVAENALATVFGITPVPFLPDALGYLRDITLRSAIRSLFEEK
ncbi:MAG: complex I NDUFA9 subunit family protein [Gemmatimonadaceae bacterium]